MDYHHHSSNTVASRIFGRNISSRFPRTGNWIHILIVIALILIILSLLGVI
jgi:hypothetical protein